MVTTRIHTTPLSPGRRGLPPPPLAFDLTVTDRRVGWVRGDVIGFRGFGSEVEATHATSVAHRGLERRLAGRDGRRATLTMPVDTERLELGRRGGVEVVLANGRPLATLLRPGVGPLSGDESFGIELRVPRPTYESRMRAMAHVVYRELRTSGTRWAMWAGDDRRPAPAPAVHEPEPAVDDVRPAATAPVDGRRTGRRRWAPIATVAGLVVLLIAFNVPERPVLILSGLGLAGLFAIRLFAMLAGWPPRRPVRA